MESIAYKSALELRGAIIAKDISAVEVMQLTLSRMEKLEPTINAFVTQTPELALKAAKAADDALAKGETVGPLHGLPISVKDLINVGGIRATFGSRTLADSIAAADAPSVERIRNAGACIVGKTTTTEFGCKAGGGDSPLTGITRNPWNLSMTTGGSSAGAGASVAAGITPFALGTDGGGSIRIPSSFCGLFGIKGQFGRVPVYPTSATPNLAHVGPMTRTVRDAALLLNVMSGFDGRDPGSVSESRPDFLAACDKTVAGMRIAWSPTLGYARPTPEVLAITERAVKVFEGLGCTVDLVENVFDKDPIDQFTAEFYAGVGTRLKEPMQHSRELLDPAVALFLDTALEQKIESYYTSVFNRYALREKVRQLFSTYDLLLSPTLPVMPFAAGTNVPPEMPGYNMVSWVSYTYPFNLSGNPAASIPCGFSQDNLPVGLQLVGGTNREVDILRAAAAFEAVQPWADRKPPLNMS
jgi:Asp-tRNA(Asn)/Glu-tRNA(Gln) amidotransferase A subunit family amidase